jgi:hypothetical protein
MEDLKQLQGIINEAIQNVNSSVGELKGLFIKSKNKSPTLKKHVPVVINSILAVYNHMRPLVKDESIPSGNLVARMFEDTFANLVKKKDEDVKNFIEFIEWIKTMLQKHSSALLELNGKQNEIERLKKENVDLKNANQALGNDMKLEDDDDDEDELLYSETLCVPKLKTPLDGVFSYYGRIKWLLIDKEGLLTDESLEKLKKLGWKFIVNGVYESPIVLSFEDHSSQLQKTIDGVWCNEYDKLHIVATYGSIPGFNVHKKNEITQNK